MSDSEIEDSFIDYRQKTISDSDNSFDKDNVDVEDSSNSFEASISKDLKKEKLGDIEIPETDSELESSTANDSSEDDEPIMKGKKKRIVIMDSDTEDEEDNRFEKRALSPQTRFSITGIRPKDISSEESEEYDESENEKSLNAITNSYKSIIENPNSDNSTSHSNTEDSNKSFTSKSNNNKETTANIERKSHSTSKNRFSTFNSSISNKLSSTMTAANSIVSKSPMKLLNSTGESDSVEIVSFNNQTIDISSGSDNSPTIQSSTPIIGEHQIPRYKNLVQTKLTSSFKTSSTSRIQRPQFVSEEYLNSEIRKLEDLKSELTTCVNLTKVHQNLPDGGSKMLERIEKLKIEIKKRANMISNLVIDKQVVKKLEAPTWDDLNAVTNAIQPKYTGKIGLATFTAEKALTIDRLKDIHGSLETCPNESILSEDPKGLKITLMDHQKYALTWMGWREKQKPRGGILADDMGLGKTLTMISLILISKIRGETTQNEESTDDDSDDKSNNKGWSAKGRKNYHDGGTLVVAPASLLKQWESEVENRTKRHLLSICVHHGNNRDTKPRHLAKYDIVVTTYNIVSREFKLSSALFGINWQRIILDEAHVIRNHKSQSSVGVCGLKGKYRWALTGTPIQNKEMDLYAILKFLRCSPFDDLQHWKKWIDNKSAGGQQRLNTIIKSLMLRRTKVQLQEKGELMCLPEKDIKLIDVVLDKDEMNVYQKIMIFSRTLFAQFLHQRAEKDNDIFYTKEGNCQTFMQVKDPNGAYHKMHQKIVRLHGRTDVKSHEILVLLLRLRQICCHPGLIQAMLDDDDNNISGGNISSEHSGTDFDLLDQLEKLQINEEHVPSSSSLTDSLDNSKDMAISKASSKVLLKSNPVFNLNRLSSKMIKIIQVLEDSVLNTNDKAIIVSQWTSVLNLLQTHLTRKKISCCCLNGSVAVKNRNEIVTNFNKETSPERIMLLSLTAGGVGLNLVGANHLFLIDLHWNPQLESQAQDRIYRVGQKKHVYIYKFMCKDTIEERIKALQDIKVAIANGVLTGTKSEAGSKLTMEDLKSLFGL